MTNPIREAAANIPGHWIKGDYIDSETGDSFCSVGHLFNVLDSESIYYVDSSFYMNTDRDSEEYDRAEELLLEVIEEQYPERLFRNYSDWSSSILMRHLPTFNDHDDTTEADVIAVFEKAAVRWDESL